MSERANPFGDLSEFKPSVSRKATDPKVLDEIAAASDFPSREARTVLAPAPAPVPAPVAATTKRSTRRYTTGRNRQINIKATEETISLFYSLADELNQPLGAVLQSALESLSRDRSNG